MNNYSNNQKIISLNRESALPLYYQLKEHLKESILRGQYKINDKLPTEEELCKQLSISRPVVRQAYDELIKEGLIGRHKGRGTFVKEQADKKSLFKEFIGFSFEKNIPDLTNNSKIVKIEKICDPVINLRMKIAEESEVLHLERVVHDCEYPISMIESYVPICYFKNIEDYMLIAIDKTVMEIVENFYGIYIQNAKRSLKAMRISDEKAAFLHGSPDDLIYEVETKYFDAFERIAILEYVTYLTSKMKLEVEISRKPGS